MTHEELEAIQKRTDGTQYEADVRALIAEIRRLNDVIARGASYVMRLENVQEQSLKDWQGLRTEHEHWRRRAEAAEARIVALEARPCTTPFTELDARWQDLVARFQDERRLRLAAESRVRELELRLEEERS